MSNRAVLSALLPALWAIAGPASFLTAQSGGAEANNGCYDCHADPEEVMEFEDGVEVSIGFEKRSFLESAHGKLECTACHVGLDVFEHMSMEWGTYIDYRRERVKRCEECHTDRSEAVAPEQRPDKLIGSTLHPDTNGDAPLCSTCHSPHAVARDEKLLATVSHTCADCHEEVYATFAASAHGGGVTEPGGSDSPACVDCHHGHEDAGSGMTHRNVRLGRPCMGCHGDSEMMDRHGISTGVVSTYLNDFHGVSVRYYGEAGGDGGLPTLVCSDCHGVHDVAEMSESNVLLMKGNLQKVCQKCHEKASATFPDAWLSHYEPSLTTAPLVFLVQVSYWIFIPFVILGLSMQIFAHLVLFPRRKRKERGDGARQSEESHKDSHEDSHEDSKNAILPGDDRRMVTRFGRRHRLEHFLVMISFTLLVLTGLPQKFWDHGWALSMTSMFGGIDMMRTIHRVTGIVFTGLCVIHLTIAISGILRRRTGMTMVPTGDDFRGAWDNLKYYVGHADRPPKFDRYEYRQKFEYWGMLVGSLVMILSGFVLYFPLMFSQYLPGQFIPAAKMAHTWEAMMALLTIIIWHMYGAHLNPDSFPADRSIFTGKISVARMKHEHVLEWEREKDRLLAELADSDDPPASPKSS